MKPNDVLPALCRRVAALVAVAALAAHAAAAADGTNVTMLATRKLKGKIDWRQPYTGKLTVAARCATSVNDLLFLSGVDSTGPLFFIAGSSTALGAMNQTRMNARHNAVTYLYSDATMYHLVVMKVRKHMFTMIIKSRSAGCCPNADLLCLTNSPTSGWESKMLTPSVNVMDQVTAGGPFMLQYKTVAGRKTAFK
ncbi:hypothetical protein GX586_08545 [bacterium]|nr:hypothetical protein [bacterium]